MAATAMRTQRPAAPSPRAPARTFRVLTRSEPFGPQTRPIEGLARRRLDGDLHVIEIRHQAGGLVRAAGTGIELEGVFPDGVVVDVGLAEAAFDHRDEFGEGADLLG